MSIPRTAKILNQIADKFKTKAKKAENLTRVKGLNHSSIKYHRGKLYAYNEIIQELAERSFKEQDFTNYDGETESLK